MWWLFFFKYLNKNMFFLYLLQIFSSPKSINKWDTAPELLCPVSKSCTMYTWSSTQTSFQWRCQQIRTVQRLHYIKELHCNYISATRTHLKGTFLKNDSEQRVPFWWHLCEGKRRDLDKTQASAKCKVGLCRHLNLAVKIPRFI